MGQLSVENNLAVRYPSSKAQSPPEGSSNRDCVQECLLAKEKLAEGKQLSFPAHVSAGRGLLGNKRTVPPLGVLLGVGCGS